MKVEKGELFRRLAEGHAGGITVVTPNARLAQALVAEFDSFQSKEKSAWEAPDVLPLGAFLERLYEDASYAAGDGAIPSLLSASQERWLWSEAIAASRYAEALLEPHATAAACRKAWKLVHEWRLPVGGGNEDALAFSSWAHNYLERSEKHIDSARLPDLLLGIEGWRKPKQLVAYGFDIVPPQARAFLDALGAADCGPERRQGAVARLAFASAKEELERAAAWARARLEANPGARIGVVVPELQARRREAVRVFSRTLSPGYNLPGAAKAALPFNVSLGEPVGRYPVAALALRIIEFSQREIPFEEASGVVLSPFIAGAEREQAARARLDVKLRRALGATVSLPKLVAASEGAPMLRALLEKIFAARSEAAKSASDWARHFSALLEAAGFPGERTLDSEEYQARAKLHELLAELSQLGGVARRLSFAQAFGVLRRLAEETLFQPEARGEAPIQVLGVLESAGLAFDHLWVSGLTDEAWPLRAQPEPFVPVALQKKAGVPQASPEASLALDRRITEGWAGAAAEVVLSYFTQEEDRKLAPSPLILGFREGALDAPLVPSLKIRIREAGRMQALEDFAGPAVGAAKSKGGTRVLADQAACPFRAFARWRLSAQAMEEPSEGLDAAQRGKLLHELMAALWNSLKDSKSLEKDIDPVIRSAAESAVKALELEGRFAELERARLERLAREWLEVERARPPFEVVAVERPVSFSVAGISFEGRIDRMDRVEGGHVLIDYKTSKSVTPNHWKPPRPHDPQLPLYAISSREDVAAVAFAKVRPGQMRLMGFSRDKGALPRVEAAKNWRDLMEGWRREALALGKGFAAGDALVDPKKGIAATCRFCDLQTLCRVYEKLNPLKEEDPEDE